MTTGITSRKAKLLKDRELRNKYFEDQLKIGLRNQLRSLRDARGLTQGELADLIGTKQSVISRLERNPIKVGMPTFLDIARVLDVGFVARFEAIDTIIEWYDNPSQKKMTPRKSQEILAQVEEKSHFSKGKEDTGSSTQSIIEWLVATGDSGFSETDTSNPLVDSNQTRQTVEYYSVMTN